MWRQPVQVWWKLNAAVLATIWVFCEGWLTVVITPSCDCPQKCPILIVLSLKSLAEVFSGAASPMWIAGHFPSPADVLVNTVWFYCHFLWWKVVNLFPSPSSTISHLFGILSQWNGGPMHLFSDSPQTARSHQDLSVPLCCLLALGSTPEASSLPPPLYFHRGFVALFSNEEPTFLRQGWRFFKQQGWSWYQQYYKHSVCFEAG